MKTKIVAALSIICLMAVSITFISAKSSEKKTVMKESNPKIDQPVGGFALEDRN